MLQSKLFSKTYKQSPKEAEIISHKLLIRAGYIDRLASGIYSLLPLGFRVHKKIENIIREEMDKIDGQEVLLPTLQPKNLWRETTRWQTMDPPLFKVKDRHNKELALGSTHEEVITDLARRFIKSYKDLPLAVYQIQNKFRNEIRSSGGLLRVREFIMKDLYSFHTTIQDLQNYYQRVKKTYLNIFQRCGLKIIVVEASSGSIGGEVCHEFAYLTPNGEDKIAICTNCGYAANQELVKEKTDCPQCQQQLKFYQAIENGHIFNLGKKYSQQMKAYYLDPQGQKKPLIMGCYGIGLGRLLATIVEAHNDVQGIIWPKTVTPMQVHLLNLVPYDKQINQQADSLYQILQKNKISVLYDDRQESPGKKLKDADLIGISLRLIISTKTKKQIEWKERAKEKIQLVPISNLNKRIKDYYLKP